VLLTSWLNLTLTEGGDIVSEKVIFKIFPADKQEKQDAGF
jgi:hypothetical protein